MPDPLDHKGADESAPGNAELPSAADLEKVVESSIKHKEEEKHKLQREADEREKAKIQALRKPVKISEEETKDLVHKFRSAAEKEEKEYVILTFPAKLLEDGGRAINNLEPGWPDTLTGAARGYYEAWDSFLKQKGYKISARVSDFDDDGLIKDINLVISW
jgi:hypothetical protein